MKKDNEQNTFLSNFEFSFQAIGLRKIQVVFIAHKELVNQQICYIINLRIVIRSTLFHLKLTIFFMIEKIEITN